MDMQWIQIKVTGKTQDLDNISAVMSMVENSLFIEDFSDVTTDGMYGALLDESLLNADKTKAAGSVFIPETSPPIGIIETISPVLPKIIFSFSARLRAFWRVVFASSIALRRPRSFGEAAAFCRGVSACPTWYEENSVLSEKCAPVLLLRWPSIPETGRLLCAACSCRA